MIPSLFYLHAAVLPPREVVNSAESATEAGSGATVVSPPGNMLAGDGQPVSAFQIQVWLAAGSDAVSANFELSYDPSATTYISTTGPSGWDSRANPGKQGSILFSAFNPSFTAPIATNSDSLLATIDYAASSSAARGFRARLTWNDFSDVNLNVTIPPLPVCLGVGF